MKRALLFSGQGAQHVGMGRDLTEVPEIAELYKKADAILGFPFSQISFEGPETRLTDTDVCQPALYVHGYALLTLALKEIPGFRFDAAAGLSLGEYTAHAAAGTFDFETGLRLVHRRGALMQEACKATEGGMLALLGADAPTAQAIAAESGIDVANYNCPGQIVLSGAKSQIPQAQEVAKAKGVRRALPLNVAGAYHSRLMASAEAALVPDLEKAAISMPRVPVPANFSGTPASDVAEIRTLLAKQVTGSVRWEESIRHLLASGITQFVEFGPGGVLAGFLKRIDPEAANHCISISNLNDFKTHSHALNQ
ncbi:[acyl-carrier-protein] S-malonyltransferase [Verrucomicrobium sp. GAS474]|uniref:ACP S-malonyltransferase n=1 Tax=Verrucomicrobium sp. GAS474 TaxID=1882831 RepID=UPI00087DCE17|nr:ACP S-malonyltransferase [Verrucomicrobium sp. GAS474]SDU19269.1 [acyl-carrier-protein] S-malonyltransferase [Verrucomicrobium sp. GAS474]